MKFLELCKTLWQIVCWVATNPIKTALILGLAVLFVLGLIYSLRYLLKPSTWIGTDKNADTTTTTASSPATSVFSVMAAMVLLTAVGGIAWTTLSGQRAQNKLATGLDRLSNELGILVEEIDKRGILLDQTLHSLNDSLLESLIRLVEGGGGQAARRYAAHLRTSQRTTADLLHQAGRYEEVIRGLRRSATLLHKYQPDPVLINEDAAAYYQEEMRWLRLLMAEAGRAAEWTAEALDEGSQALQKYIRRAQRYLPDVHAEAPQIEAAIQLDISTRLRREGEVKYLLPTLDVNEWQQTVRTLRSDTSEAAHRMATKLRTAFYQRMILAVGALLMALVALFANRFGWASLGAISIIGFIGLFFFNMGTTPSMTARNHQIVEACQALRQRERGEILRVPLMQLAGTLVDTRALERFLRSTMEGSNLLQALETAFLDKSLFKGALEFTGTGAARLYLRKTSTGARTLSLPLDPTQIAPLFASAHAQALEELTRSGRLLKKVLADYEANAKLCADQAQLGFPQSWHTALNLAGRLLNNIDRLFSIHRTTQTDRIIRERDNMGVLRPMLKDLEACANEVRGLMNTVMGLSEQLMRTCRAQLEALEQLQGDKQQRLELGQAHRVVAFGRKAEQLLAPLLESAWVLGPAQAAIQATCQPATPAADAGERAAYWTWVALLGAILSTLWLTRLVTLLMRGLLLLFPCLEVFRICT